MNVSRVVGDYDTLFESLSVYVIDRKFTFDRASLPAQDPNLGIGIAECRSISRPTAYPVGLSVLPHI